MRDKIIFIQVILMDQIKVYILIAQMRKLMYSSQDRRWNIKGILILEISENKIVEREHMVR
jgi:hypothetical protein